MIEESENAHVVFIANIDNLCCENVFMVKAVATVLNCFVRICIIINAEFDGNVDGFHC